MAKIRYLSSIRLLLNNDLSNKALLNGLSEDFELRRYDEQLMAQTWVTGDQDAASRAGFKILADYIFGNNSAANGKIRKISMTAPVTMQSETKKGSGKSQKIAMTAPVSI